MLSISKQQIDLMGTQKKQMYTAELIDYCSANYAPQVASLDQVSLEAFTDESIAEAQESGFVSAKHISHYAILRLQFLPQNFSDLPWVNSIVKDTKTNNETKMHSLRYQAQILLEEVTKDSVQQ